MTTVEADTRFEAPDLIEVMEEAVRYNRFLIETLARWAEGTHRLLDFGAGNGRFCAALQQRDYATYAVEPDAELRVLIGRATRAPPPSRGCTAARAGAGRNPCPSRRGKTGRNETKRAKRRGTC